MDDAIRDIIHATRGLIRNRGFTATVVLTFALAIGANTAIFSVFENVLLAPLPYPHSDRLVRIYSSHVERAGQGSSSIPDFREWKQRSTTIEAMEAFRRATVLIDGHAEQRISMVRATPGLLDLVGARAMRGRLIQDEDLRVDAPLVVVLSYESWMGRFGGDPNIVGRPIGLAESAVSSAGGILKEDITVTVYTVVGIAAPIAGSMFGGPTAEPVQAFSPLLIATDNNRESRVSRSLQVVARLREGVILTQSQAELERIGSSIREQHKEVQWMPLALSIYESTVSNVRPALTAILAATGLILLIAVSNIANLLLARGSSRKNEISVRAALGASRLRLTRLLLTESLILAFLGGIAGIILGYAGIQILRYMEPSWLPRLGEIAINGAVLAFALAITIASGLLFGLVPLMFLRQGLMLNTRQAAGPDGSQRWLRSGLVVSQLTLSLILLIGSGLMIRSFMALKNVAIGIDYTQTVTFSLGVDGFMMGRGGPGRSAELQRYREVLGHVRAIPGVVDATVTSQPPLTGSSGSVGVELLSGGRRGQKPSVGLVGVNDNFFEFFGSRVIAGRLFGPQDAARPDDAVVVDSHVAEALWPGESAVGQRIRFYDIESVVVGVAEPIRYGDPAAEIRPKLYHLLNRSGGGVFGSAFLLRYRGELKAIMPVIESRVKEVDSTLRFGAVRPLEDLYDQYLREPRFYVMLLGTLGTLALAVAAVGVYGVVAYSVVQRTGEIGIRMALGGRPHQIVSLFFQRTLVLLIPGLVAGFLGSAWLTRYIQSLLFQIKPTDTITIAAMSALLATTALIATLIPMRRALRIDPARTLRSE